MARSGKSELTNLVLTAQQVQSIMDRILLWSGRRIDLAQPFVDARLPDGSRLHITIPEITSEHWAINIRKHLLRGKSLNDLVELDVMDVDVYAYLVGAVKERKNLLVSGSTQAGKTTLLNALVSSIPVTERVITIEEVFELKPKLPDCVAMQTRTSNLDGSGEISIRRLIKEALRMRPSRLIIGEIREAESLDLLIALNSGIPGMATLHANSAREAIRKLQTLPMLAGENITQEFLTPTVARARLTRRSTALELGKSRGKSPSPRVSKTSATNEKSSRTSKQLLQIISALISAFIITLLLTTSLQISVAISLLITGLPFILAKRKSERLRVERDQAWPVAIDEIVASLQAGLSITESVIALVEQGPPQLKETFRRVRAGLSGGGDLETLLRIEMQILDSATADQTLSTLLFAKQFGGNEVITTLRMLSTFLREEIKVREEIDTRFGWVRNSAVLGAV
ncbi:MAG: hypothetical protein EB112_05225, partial [Actinobacteria bacterium]|nr:hypothetical protein [Actinomycetota bacterium]